MNKVFKYGPLPLGDPFVLDLPLDARLLHFSAQLGERLWVWADVDPDAPKRGRHLMIVGTGHPKPQGGTHVGSWVSDEYVWHLFDWGGLPPVQ